MIEKTTRSLIRDVPDFPTKGIMFRDITPVLQNAEAFGAVVKMMAGEAAKYNPDVVVGIESRGFVFGAPVALEIGVGFIPVRKVGKLPAETIRAEYALEYGTNAVEIHKDAITPGQRVVVIDDLLATGGTAVATTRLIEQLGGKVAALVFLIELTYLSGKELLQGYEVETLVQY